jgi:hypothetical protein
MGLRQPVGRKDVQSEDERAEDGEPFREPERDVWRPFDEPGAERRGEIDFPGARADLPFDSASLMHSSVAWEEVVVRILLVEDNSDRTRRLTEGSRGVGFVEDHAATAIWASGSAGQNSSTSPFWTSVLGMCRRWNRSSPRERPVEECRF